MRFDCPVFKRRMEKSDKRNFKEKKAYITWEVNDINSSSDSENKIINLGLMLKDYESREEQNWYIDSGCSKYMAGDASKFIHISPKNSGYVIYGDNKQRPLDQQAQQVISNDTNRSLSLIDYFWLFLPMIVDFWLSFDACFLLRFLLSLMIIFYDCSWLSFDCL